MAIPKMQPSTVIGIGVLVAGVAGPIAAAVASAITHDGHWIALTGVAVGAVAAGVTHILLPDNSAESGAVGKLFQDAVTAAVSKNLAPALPVILQDGLAIVNALQPAAPPPPPTPSAPAQGPTP